MWLGGRSAAQILQMLCWLLTFWTKLGRNRHVLTFPVEHGATLNMVAFVHNDREEWPSATKLTLPTTKAEALDDFRQFGQNVKNIIQLTSDKLERVRPASLYPPPSHTSSDTKLTTTNPSPSGPSSI